MVTNNTEFFKKNEQESIDDFIYRVCVAKDSSGMTWDDVRDICNRELNVHCSESYYRKNFSCGRFSQQRTRDAQNNRPNIPNYNDTCFAENCSPEESERLSLSELKAVVEAKTQLLAEEKFKVRKERSTNTKLLSQMWQFDIYKEIADEVAEKILKNQVLPEYTPIQIKNDSNKAILVLSDWHFGVDIRNFKNIFNEEICKQRVAKVRDETIKFCKQYDVQQLYVVNLGDMVAGRIHPTLRMDSTEGVIQQTLMTAEIIREMLEEFTEKSKVKVEYYWCLDNHSRIEPDKEKSRKDENLVYVSTHLLKATVGKTNPNVTIHDNTYGDDIITFTCNGWTIGGCHGDLDKQKKAISNLSLFTSERYDLILSAHMHHFSADETCDSLLLCNGSLMGTDSYASDLRLSSHPSQNLILVTPDSVMELLRRIPLK